VYDQNIFGSSLEVFGNHWLYLWKSSETFVWPSEKFWATFGNLQKVRNFWKNAKNAVMYCDNFIYENKNYMVAWRGFIHADI